MNQKILFFLSIAVLFTSSILFANNNPILVTTIENNKYVEVSMNLEINGTMRLYSVLNEELDLGEVEPVIQQSIQNITFTDLVLHPDKDFYLGLGDEVEVITPINFKRMAKKYFAATPALMERIGKRGFRYKNLPAMISYYNKIMAKEGGLTKGDMVAN